MSYTYPIPAHLANFVERDGPTPGAAWHQSPDGTWATWKNMGEVAAWAVELPVGRNLSCVRACTIRDGKEGRAIHLVPADTLHCGPVEFKFEAAQPEAPAPKGLLRYVFHVAPTGMGGFSVLCGSDTPMVAGVVAYCDAKQDADELAFALNLAVSTWAAKTPGAIVED